MTTISRRSLLAAGALASASTALGAGLRPPAVVAEGQRAPAAAGGPLWVGAGEFRHIYDPTPTSRPGEYLNDHTFVRAADGTWHLFGITGVTPGSPLERDFAHATAPSLAGPWTRRPPALSLDPGYYGEVHLWAPHVIEDQGTYHMFYAGGGNGNSAISVATSTDLFTWTRRPAGPLFRGLVARDPYVVRIGERWHMYYCEIAGWGSHHTVACRTSTDLRNWSAPVTVFTDASIDLPAGNVSVTESPYVVARDGWFYLFIGPRNGYVGTDAFASRDPMRFAVDGYAGHVPAHAAEVIQDGSDWWVSAGGWYQHGVHLAPLNWRQTPPIWHGPGNPVVALNGQGRLEVFALDASDHGILRRVQTDPNTNGWGGWERFSDPVATVPAIGANADGRLEAFALEPDGTGLLHRVQQIDGRWGAWQSFGGPAGAVPTVSRNSDGRLEVFALGPGGAYLTHRWQNTANADAANWSAWTSFGTAAGAPPVVGVNADGRLEVLALGPGGAYLAHRWQNAPSGGWSDWDTSFGGPAGAAPTVARDLRGILQVFALVPGGPGVSMRPQTSPSGEWGSWQGLGSSTSWAYAAPTVVANADGRLEAFYLLPGSPGGERVEHRWQNGDGSWHPPELFGSGETVGMPSAARDAVGRIHVFAVDRDGTVRERVQTVASGGWGDWRVFGDRRIAVIPTGSVS